MGLLTDCVACRNGEHKHHMEVIEAVPLGMLGGVHCPCKGECKGRIDPQLDDVQATLAAAEVFPAR